MMNSNKAYMSQPQGFESQYPNLNISREGTPSMNQES